MHIIEYVIGRSTLNKNNNLLRFDPLSIQPVNLGVPTAIRHTPVNLISINRLCLTVRHGRASPISKGGPGVPGRARSVLYIQLGVPVRASVPGSLKIGHAQARPRPAQVNHWSVADSVSVRLDTLSLSPCLL